MNDFARIYMADGGYIDVSTKEGRNVQDTYLSEERYTSMDVNDLFGQEHFVVLKHVVRVKFTTLEGRVKEREHRRKILYENDPKLPY